MKEKGGDLAPVKEGLEGTIAELEGKLVTEAKNKCAFSSASPSSFR